LIDTKEAEIDGYVTGNVENHWLAARSYFPSLPEVLLGKRIFRLRELRTTPN
jgi:hypothetical protein